MAKQIGDKRYPNYLWRRVSDNWLVDGEYHIIVDMEKLSPGFVFTKGMSYDQCIDASLTGGGMDNPLPQLLSTAAAPEGWPAGIPWNGFILIDIKEASEFASWAVFAANNPAANGLAPSVEYWDETLWTWPAVLSGKGLLDITNVVDSGNLTGTVSGFYLRPETRANCKTRIRQWWTTTPWVYGENLRLPIDVTAAADEVFANYPNGASFRHVCLHDHVQSPSLVINTVNGQGAPFTVPQRDFPATIPKTWIPEKRNNIKETGGRFFREERKIFIPFDPLDKRTLPRITSS
jgi:hypothetical protein